MTHGLLNRLTPRELAAVLAHETSHIANNDMRIMGLADAVRPLTHVMALFGLLLTFAPLPLMLFGAVWISPLGLMLLLLAPTVSALLQLALSRTREFLADMQAVRLTGDPEGLVSALDKLEHQGAGYWRRVFNPVYRDPNPSVLRSHPATRERIERLMSLKRVPSSRRLDIDAGTRLETLPNGYRVHRHPRIRWTSNIWR
ncbi:MAG: Zn-dependent protease [Proteobacteria bacterium]|nr:MAG: Zn-dependent protease [Pseudomonadota bacterium]